MSRIFDNVDVAWFPPEGDPLLPENLGLEVKPILVQFDDYQTYDAIVWQSINRQLPLNKIGFGNFGNMFNRQDGVTPHEAIVIERFTPFTDDWADQYSDFIKEIFDYFLQLPIKWEFDSVIYSATTEYTLFLSEPEPDEVTLTWLYDDVNCISKRKQVIKSANVIPLRFYPNICSHSLVISGGNGYLREQITQAIDERLLYSTRQQLISFVQNNFNRGTAKNPDVPDPYNREALFIREVTSSIEESFSQVTTYQYPTEQTTTYESEPYIEYEISTVNGLSSGFETANFVANGFIVQAQINNFKARLESAMSESGVPSEFLIREFTSPAVLLNCGNVGFFTGGGYFLRIPDELLPPETGQNFRLPIDLNAVPPEGTPYDFITNYFAEQSIIYDTPQPPEIGEFSQVDAGLIAPRCVNGLVQIIYYFAGHKITEECDNVIFKDKRNIRGFSEPVVINTNTTTQDDTRNVETIEFDFRAEAGIDENNYNFCEIVRANNNYWQETSAITTDTNPNLSVITYNDESGWLSSLDVNEIINPFSFSLQVTNIEEPVNVNETRTEEEKVPLQDCGEQVFSEPLPKKQTVIQRSKKVFSYELDFDTIEKIDGFLNHASVLQWEVENENSTELIKDMPDSLRVKEIHQALEAQKFATYESNNGQETRVANIGYYVERIARLLGINVLPDGITYEPKPPELQDEEPEPPYGKNYWGVVSEDLPSNRINGSTNVSSTEVQHDAIAYEIISNKFAEDSQTGEQTLIKQGGYALINNIPQLLQTILDDFDKALGLQESASFTLRSLEGDDSNPKICTYEGLHSLIAEIAYMNAEISRRSSQSEIASLKTLGICIELLGALGLPISPKTFKAYIGTEENRGLNVESEVYYPALKSDSPKITELIAIVMENLSHLLGKQIDLPQEEREKIKSLSDDELDRYIQSIRDNIDGSTL